jgi:hypothetical protein
VSRLVGSEMCIRDRLKPLPLHTDRLTEEKYKKLLVYTKDSYSIFILSDVNQNQI